MRSRRDIIVTVCCIAMIVLTASAVSQSNREAMFRQSCESNLSSLGKAMQIYANDYEDELPKAGSRRRNEWVPTVPNWAGRNRYGAYGMTRDNSYTGKVTATSSLYLLVKYEEAEMGWFVCPGEPNTTPLNLGRVPEELPEAEASSRRRVAAVTLAGSTGSERTTMTIVPTG